VVSNPVKSGLNVIAVQEDGKGNIAREILHITLVTGIACDTFSDTPVGWTATVFRVVYIPFLTCQNTVDNVGNIHLFTFGGTKVLINMSRRLFIPDIWTFTSFFMSVTVCWMCIKSRSMSARLTYWSLTSLIRSW